MNKTIVIAVMVGLGRVAAAQPTVVEPEPVPTPTPTPTPTPSPTPTPTPTPSPSHEEAAIGADSPTVRPNELAFAIGVGYAFPTALDMPNTTSVRLRLASGLTFEPLLTIGNSKQTTDPGGASTSTSTTEFLVAGLARLPVIRRGHADFEALGGVNIDTIRVNPDGTNNNTATTTLSLGWGIAVGYWFSPHWQLSLSATNPLVSYTKNSREMGAGMTLTTSTTSFAVDFSPIVALMIHLYN